MFFRETLDFVAHEMGHQFGATHTFNGTGCPGGAYSASSSWEPGSGTTIMSYSSICGADNVLGGQVGELETPAEFRPPMATSWALRACDAAETPLLENADALFDTNWLVDRRADRMGLRLEGPALSVSSVSNVIEAEVIVAPWGISTF